METLDRERNLPLILETAELSKAPESCSEALRLWDAGEYVVTASMGGLGPGYEACIQTLAFELIREFGNEPLLDDEEARRKWWESRGDARRNAVVDRLDGRFGFSGAQVGAATNLAFCVLRHGYRAALSRLPANRLIRARKPEESHDTRTPPA